MRWNCRTSQERLPESYRLGHVGAQRQAPPDDSQHQVKLESKDEYLSFSENDYKDVISIDSPAHSGVKEAFPRDSKTPPPLAFVPPPSKPTNVACSIHNKWRDRRNMINIGGKWTCNNKSKCKLSPADRDWRAGTRKLRSPSRRALSPPPAKRRRPSWPAREISEFISTVGRGHVELPGLLRDMDNVHGHGKGAFSLKNLMKCRGKGQGLSTTRVVEALQASLFKRKDGHRAPTPPLRLGPGS